MNGSDVLQAGSECGTALAAQTTRDWTITAPQMGISVAEVVAHAATGPLWYALDLWSGPEDDAAFDVRVRSDTANSALVRSLVNSSRVCAASIDSAPSTTRGFHPSGSPDPSGFAALACDEMLVHTWDAADGLGLDFRPDPRLAGQVLKRLFPTIKHGDDPWLSLLWANGRIELGGAGRRTEWTWHPSPL